MINHIS